MKSSAVLLTVAGIASGVGLAYFLTRPTTSSGGGSCTSNADCPPGYICQNGECIPSTTTCTNNNDCPPGYICQNGQCVVCPPQECPCDSVWDSVNCVCSELVPYNLLAPFAATASSYYFIYYNCGTGVITNYGATSYSSCIPTTSGPYSDTVITTPFTVTCVDSAGHPICNQNVQLELSSTPINFKTQDGNFVGKLNVFLTNGSIQTTDSNGQIAVDISVQIVPNIAQSTANAQNCLTCCIKISGCNYTNVSQTTPVTVGYSLVSNPNIRGATTTQLTTNVCGAYC